MDEAEAITSAEILPISIDGQLVTKNHIALATNSSFNEEVTSKGRVRMYNTASVCVYVGWYMAMFV